MRELTRSAQCVFDVQAVRLFRENYGLENIPKRNRFADFVNKIGKNLDVFVKCRSLEIVEKAYEIGIRYSKRSVVGKKNKMATRLENWAKYYFPQMKVNLREIDPSLAMPMLKRFYKKYLENPETFSNVKCLDSKLIYGLWSDEYSELVKTERRNKDIVKRMRDYIKNFYPDRIIALDGYNSRVSVPILQEFLSRSRNIPETTANISIIDSSFYRKLYENEIEWLRGSRDSIEAGKRFEKLNGMLCDVKEADPRLAIPTLLNAHYWVKKYPQIASTIKYICCADLSLEEKEYFRGKSPYALCHFNVNGNSRIMLNSRFFGNYDVMMREMAECSSIGWFVSSDVGGIVLHELHHGLCELLLKQYGVTMPGLRGKSIRDDLILWMRANMYKTMPSRHADSTREKYLNNYEDNPGFFGFLHEAIAEAGVAVDYGLSGNSEFARSWEDKLLKYLDLSKWRRIG